MFLSMTGKRALAAASVVLACAALSLPAYAKNKDAASAGPTGEPKKTIAVGTFESPELMAGGASGPGLAVMLDNALLKDGHFVVVERGALAQVQNEQMLAKTGQVAGSSAAPSGQLTGASVMVFGTVTKFIPNASGGAVNVGGIGSSNNNSFLSTLGSSTGSTAGVSQTTAEVEINLRLVDTVTGQIVYSATASGSASSTGVNANIYTASGMSIGGQAFLNTPLGKAAQDAIEDGVKKIGIGMTSVPWSATVVENDGGTVYIAAGADRNMQPGMTLHVYRVGKQLTDPSTNAVLETMVDNVGTIQVQSVSDKVSTCTVTGGNPPARGDILKLQ
jgi:curli biogenesis system outer membrane secretion channel CsgG